MDVDLGAGQQVSLRPIDPSTLGAAGRVDVLVALQQLRSWVDAQEQVLLAAMVEPGDPPRPGRPDPVASGKQFVREEIACALTISPLTVNARLHVARELVSRLPGTLALLQAGAITMRAARLLAESVGPLPDEVAARVERRVLPRAAGQTFPNFRACVQRALLALDPRAAQDKHDAAVERRQVQTRPLADGMGSLYAELRADDLAAVLAAVQAAADALPAQAYRAGPYAADQRRADALVHLATGYPAAAAPSDGASSDGTSSDSGSSDDATSGGEAGGDGSRGGGSSGDASSGGELRRVKTRHGRRPGVQVTVALSTLLGLDNEPGELDGHGPIPAALARRIAADPTGTWRRLVTDPLGRLLDYGRSTYTPPQDLQDHVIARDRRCRFPGCARQAARCDLDHQTDWADGGPTNPRNLECLCARHHALKHETGWTVRGDPADTITWTSPTGHPYLSPPGDLPTDTTLPAEGAAVREVDVGRKETGDGSGGAERAA